MRPCGQPTTVRSFVILFALGAPIDRGHNATVCVVSQQMNLSRYIGLLAGHGSSHIVVVDGTFSELGPLSRA